MPLNPPDSFCWLRGWHAQAKCYMTCHLEYGVPPNTPHWLLPLSISAGSQFPPVFLISHSPHSKKSCPRGLFVAGPAQATAKNMSALSSPAHRRTRRPDGLLRSLSQQTSIPWPRRSRVWLRTAPLLLTIARWPLASQTLGARSGCALQRRSAATRCPSLLGFRR